MIKKGIIALLFFSFTTFVQAECNYSFQKDSGTKYNIDKISTFVVKEIRPVLGHENHMFKVNIYRSCDSKDKKIVSIDMQSNNYYLLWINGTKLSADIVKYDNRLEIDIDRDTLIWAINKSESLDFSKFNKNEDAKTYAEKKELMYQHAVLKMFAFVLAEAARFESVEVALKKTIEGDCSIDWHDFDFAVHAWRHMSDYIKLTNKVKKDQFSNNWEKPLYAPITMEQETAFEQALMAGENFEFNRTVPFHEYEFVCN